MADLAAWVARRSFDLELRGWFTDGRSGAPVARTVRKFPDSRRTQQLILKFWNVDGQRRVDDLADAWHDSPHYQQHLAEVVDRTIDLGDWRAMLMRVAGGNLNMAPLGKFLHDASFSDYCATVVRSVLGDWNEHKFGGKQTTAADVLGEMLIRRWKPIKQWARSAGISDVDRRVRPFGWPTELANPLALADGRDGSYAVDDLIIGTAHGDLSGRNILVPTRPNVAADAYVLIDYDRYSASASLTRDPMHLLVALALDSFHKVAAPLRPDLARVIVDPDTPDAAWLGYFQKISAAIHSASKEMAEEEGMGGEWEDQCLLSLVGAGLIHVGRDLHVADQKATEEWCFYLAALAADAYVQRTPADSITVHTRSEPADDNPRSLVDRHQELAGLRTRLSDGPWGVLVVQGARGIGKTALVNAALTKLGAEDAATRVQWHDVNAIAGLDASTLVDYVVGPERAGPGEHRGSSLVRLEDTLHRHRDRRVVVTIDSAENLGDPDTGRLMDPELDDALELIATKPGHRVTVLMVTRPDLRSPEDHIWPTAERFNVNKLPEDEFFEYLIGLDPRSTLDPSILSDESCATLYSKLQGNPRLAQLAYGTGVADGGLDLGTLTSLLASQDTRNVLSFLTRLLIDRLSPLRRRVLEALAAFDTPVPQAGVSQVLNDETPDEVGRALSELTEDRVVYRVASAPDQYFIPPDDGRLVLECMADENSRSDLYSFAADVLAEFRVKEPKGVADLRVHFAELRALLRAGVPGAAYEMVEKINGILRAWNCADLLLRQRLELRASLVNDRLTRIRE